MIGAGESKVCSTNNVFFDRTQALACRDERERETGKPHRVAPGVAGFSAGIFYLHVEQDSYCGPDARYEWETSAKACAESLTRIKGTSHEAKKMGDTFFGSVFQIVKK